MSRDIHSVDPLAGGYVTQPHKMPEWVVPDLDGCEVCGHTIPTPRPQLLIHAWM